MKQDKKELRDLGSSSVSSMDLVWYWAVTSLLLLSVKWEKLLLFLKDFEIYVLSKYKIILL